MLLNNHDAADFITITAGRQPELSKQRRRYSKDIIKFLLNTPLSCSIEWRFINGTYGFGKT